MLWVNFELVPHLCPIRLLAPSPIKYFIAPPKGSCPHDLCGPPSVTLSLQAIEHRVTVSITAIPSLLTSPKASQICLVFYEPSWSWAMTNWIWTLLWYPLMKGPSWKNPVFLHIFPGENLPLIGFWGDSSGETVTEWSAFTRAASQAAAVLTLLIILNVTTIVHGSRGHRVAQVTWNVKLFHTSKPQKFPEEGARKLFISPSC